MAELILPLMVVYLVLGVRRTDISYDDTSQCGLMWLNISFSNFQLSILNFEKRKAHF